VTKPDPEVNRHCTVYYFSLYTTNTTLFQDAHNKHNTNSACTQQTQHYFSLHTTNTTLIQPAHNKHNTNSACTQQTQHYFRMRTTNTTLIQPAHNKHNTISACTQQTQHYFHALFHSPTTCFGRVRWPSPRRNTQNHKRKVHFDV
jgi:hypothetical protein